MQTTVKTPSWHRDPSGVHQYRYWTGDTWTCWVCSNGEVSNDGQATQVDRPELPTPGYPSPSASVVEAAVTEAAVTAEAPPEVPSFTPGITCGPIPSFAPGMPTERPHQLPPSAPHPGLGAPTSQPTASTQPVAAHIVAAPTQAGPVTGEAPLMETSPVAASPETPPVTFAPVEASWRRDPSGFYPYRYWDGDEWTSWVSSFSQVMNDNQGVECERPGPPPQAGAFVSATTITRPPWNPPDPDADLSPVSAKARGPMPWEPQPVRRKPAGPGVPGGEPSVAAAHAGEKVGRLNRRTYGIGIILQTLLALVSIVAVVRGLAQAVAMPQNGTIVTLPDGQTGPFNLVVAFTGEGCRGDKVTSTECMSYWRLRGVPEAEFRSVTAPITPEGGVGSPVVLFASWVLGITGLLRTRRRLHDIDQSSWLTLLLLIPLVNAVFMIALVFIKGTDGPNNFGPPPAKRVSGLGLLGGKSPVA